MPIRTCSSPHPFLLFQVCTIVLFTDGLVIRYHNSIFGNCRNILRLRLRVTMLAPVPEALHYCLEMRTNLFSFITVPATFGPWRRSMNLRLRPSLLCAAYRYGLLSSPAAGTEQGACCSRRLLVGVGDFRDIAVMAADRLQWAKKKETLWQLVSY